MSATRKPAPSDCNCGADRTGPTAEAHLPSCPESGAPLQPGATQPTLSESYCQVCGNMILEQGKVYGINPEAVCRCQRRLSAAMTAPQIPLGGSVEHRLYSKAQLTTLLERMARLVVQEISDNHEPERVETSTKEVYFRCRCGFRYRPDASFREHLLEVLLTKAQLQQLREAVERP